MHIFNYIIISLALFLSFIIFYRFPQISPDGANESSPFVSVIIPARNEEHNLPLILNDLEKQTYKNLEVICVDDGSEDSTAEIIKDSQAQYVQVTELPSKWRGKTWACQKGAEKAGGECYLFIDADVRLDENAIAAIVSHAGNKEPISIQPYHAIKRVYENFSLFFNMIQTGSTKLLLPFSASTDGLFGPVVMIPKTVFEKFNGYEPVSDKCVEDYCLGKFYELHGISPRLFLGGSLFSFRMYSEGFGQLLEGWTKNFSTGAGITSKIMLLLSIVWITGITVLPVEIFIAFSRGWSETAIILSAVYFLFVFSLSRSGKKLGSFPFLTSLLYPIPLLAFHLIFIYSLVSTKVFRSTTWKGRRMQV